MLYVFSLNDISGGCETDDHGIIWRIAPVFRRFTGQNIIQFSSWIKAKGGTIDWVDV